LLVLSGAEGRLAARSVGRTDIRACPEPRRRVCPPTCPESSRGSEGSAFFAWVGEGFIPSRSSLSGLGQGKGLVYLPALFTLPALPVPSEIEGSALEGSQVEGRCLIEGSASFPWVGEGLAPSRSSFSCLGRGGVYPLPFFSFWPWAGQGPFLPACPARPACPTFLTGGSSAGGQCGFGTDG
jgi:hypothetical protein